MCCSWWHFCYHSLLAILRKKIGKPREEIGNPNGFEYRYLNGLKVPYYSTYPLLSIKVTSMGMTPDSSSWGLYMLIVNKTMFIPIGDNIYSPLCTSSNVWLDGNFISAIASLVSHYSHNSDRSTTSSGLDLPQFTHITYPNMQLTQNDF